MTMADQARKLIGYNEWANDKLLAACEGLPEAEFAGIASRLQHALGTQVYWHARWMHSDRPGRAIMGEIEQINSFDGLREAYRRSHDDMRAFGTSLTDAECERTENWWKADGYDATMMLGDTIVQVVNHATQHRSETAVEVSAAGHSPGDLDYLFFIFGR